MVSDQNIIMIDSEKWVMLCWPSRNQQFGMDSEFSIGNDNHRYSDTVGIEAVYNEMPGLEKLHRSNILSMDMVAIAVKTLKEKYNI